MSTSFKVGISGAGVIGHIHANALAPLEEATLVAVAEPREEAGKAFAEEHGCAWYPTLDAMLEQADLDVVAVATPSGLHPEQVAQAARAGKHVITEKPMAITDEGATMMIDACEQAGVQLAVIFQSRLSSDVVKVRRALEKGVFGRPVLANGAMYWYRGDDYYAANGGWRGTWDLDGGGALMNQAIHTVDLLQWLMGGVESIKAHTATLVRDIQTEDTAAATFRFANGALGTMTATTCYKDSAPVRIEIIGTKGRVTLENITITHWEGEEEASDDLLTDEDRELVGDWEPNEAFGVGHRRQLRKIFQDLAAGVQPPVPGNEARVAVDTILGIYESAGSKQGHNG